MLLALPSYTPSARRWARLRWQSTKRSGWGLTVLTSESACVARTFLSPILIVQAGPGLPLLHEVGKFRRRLRLESDFLVGYWEQRGHGVASQGDAKSVSLLRQADDLRAVLRWLFDETEQSVIVFGVSLGGTIALQAVAHEPQTAKAVIAISPDADTAGSDANAYAFLQRQSALADGSRLRGKVEEAQAAALCGYNEVPVCAGDYWLTWEGSSTARNSARCCRKHYSGLVVPMVWLARPRLCAI